MARAALFDTTPDGLQQWAQEMSALLSKTILFHTHPTAGGSADAGPIFRASPTQVVAYELFSATRHIDSDAQEGDAASVTLFRAVSIDPTGEPKLLTTLSGGNGTAHLDTDMRYLTDSVVAGEQGLSLTYHTTGGTNTGNTMTGIFQVPISLNSFGSTPDIIVEEHTHEDAGQGGTLGQAALQTATVSFSGSIGTESNVNIALSPDSFFPMLHVENSMNWVQFATGVNDQDPDNPRFVLRNFDAVSSHAYNVDCRYLDTS